MNKNTIIFLSSLISLSFSSLSAYSHETEDAVEHSHSENSENKTPIDDSQDKNLDKLTDEHQKKNSKPKDNTRVFKEGTLNIISPSTFKKDMFYILYSHNYFQAAFPRGSNPAFHFNYTPIERLQFDTILSLRSSPLEFEVGGKYQILDEFKGDMLSVTPRLSYNTRGNAVGLDVSASKIFFTDIWQIGLGYRAINYFGDPKVDDLTSSFVHGIGLNTIVRVWKDWHVFGDAVFPFNANIISKHGFIWSSGIKKRIPDTPHILTLYVGNSNESTLTGRTISNGNGKYPDMLKLGFNFSIGINNFSKLPEKLF